MKTMYKIIADKYINKTRKVSNCYLRYLFIKHLRERGYKERIAGELLGLNHSSINYYYNKYVMPSIDSETMVKANAMLEEINHLSRQINEIANNRYFAVIDGTIYIIEGNNEQISIDNGKIMIKITNDPVELNELKNLIYVC